MSSLILLLLVTWLRGFQLKSGDGQLDVLKVAKSFKFEDGEVDVVTLNGPLEHFLEFLALQEELVHAWGDGEALQGTSGLSISLHHSIIAVSLLGLEAGGDLWVYAFEIIGDDFDVVGSDDGGGEGENSGVFHI